MAFAFSAFTASQCRDPLLDFAVAHEVVRAIHAGVPSKENALLSEAMQAHRRACNSEVQQFDPVFTVIKVQLAETVEMEGSGG